MRINPSHYESLLIDFLEGKLDEMGMATIYSFLNHHPHIAEEFEHMRLAYDHPSELHFEASPDFSFLKKPEQLNPEDYQDKLIGLMEGDLSLSEMENMTDTILHYPEIKSELSKFESTRLIADESIVFPDKSLLKRDFLKIAFYQQDWFRYSAAAILMLCMGIGIWMQFNRSMPNYTPSLSQHKVLNAEKVINPEIKKEAIASIEKPITISNNKVEFKQTLYQNKKLKSIKAKRNNIEKASFNLPDEIVELNSSITFTEIPDLVFPVDESENVSQAIASESIQKNENSPKIAAIQKQNNSVEWTDYINQRIDDLAVKSLASTSNENNLQAPSQKLTKVGLAAITLFNQLTGSNISLEQQANSDGGTTINGIHSLSLFASR